MTHETLPVAVAIERFLTDKEPEVTEKTHYNYSTSLRMMRRWCDDNRIPTVGQLDLERIQAYKEYRLQRVKPITARNDMRVVRQFTEFLAAIGAFPADAPQLIRIPRTTDDDDVADTFLTKDEADAILTHLQKFEYASSRHIVALIFWKTGMRISGLRALDVEDFDPIRPALELRHRPDTGTPLKNKHRSERDVLLTEETAAIIQEFIENRRPDVTDDNGRHPLIATDNGRRVHSSIQKLIYTATRPCTYNGGSCPFDRDPATCKAVKNNFAHECPGSVSPHALRRGYVTAARNAGQPRDVTKDRTNMSDKVMEKHYDKGSYDEKAERRREFLMDI